MGKKLRGAALRAKKRARDAVDELQERQAEKAAASGVSVQADEELFVLDTTGGIVPPHHKPTSKKSKTRSQSAQGKEEELVEKLLRKYDKDTLVKQAEKGRQLQESRLRKRSLRGNTTATFDLWGGDSSESQAVVSSGQSKPPPVVTNSGIGSALAGTAPAHVSVKRRKVSDDLQTKKQQVEKVDVANAGQSYCPDPVAHKTTISSAVAIEMARDAAIQEKQTPLAQGLSEETRALLVGSDTELESDSESESGDETMAVGPLVKRTDKKTRAQRNKEQRLRQQEAIREKQKRQKKLINEVSEIPRYTKEIKRQERRKQIEKEEQEAAARNFTPLGKNVHQKLSGQNPIGAPTFPVALPSEVKNASLRTIKPKGSLATDRIASLMDRNMAPKSTNNPKHARGKRRKKSLKGKRNKDGLGDGFEVKG